MQMKFVFVIWEWNLIILILQLEYLTSQKTNQATLEQTTSQTQQYLDIFLNRYGMFCLYVQYIYKLLFKINER